MKGRISEIFESVQGEGLYFGERQIFIRFFGCNLDCKFCDTKQDYFFECAAEELFEKIKNYKRQQHYLSFTGGEPLLQKDFLKRILELTSEHGYKNYLETNGTMPDELEEVIGLLHIVAMDLKFPTSTGLDNFWDKHFKFLEVASKKEVFLKTVICDDTSEEDLLKGLSLIKEVNLGAVLVLQPNSYQDYRSIEEKLNRFKQLAMDKGVVACVIPQVHKIIGVK